MEPATIQSWKEGIDVRRLRLVVRAAKVFGVRWMGSGMSELGWLMSELQEKHEINPNVLYRRGVTKKSYITLRVGGVPTFSVFCQIVRAFRLEREELQQVLHQAYDIIRRQNNEEQ